MAKTKYVEYYDRMVEQNQELFDSFKKLHDEYELDQNGLQAKFNEEGEKIMEVVREWENKLCMQQEKGGYANFTSKLAEKFQAVVKKHFPLVDHIGLIVTISEKDQAKSNNGFQMKQIKLL